MTSEEMERAIEFLLASQAKHDAQIAELRDQVAETNRIIRMQGESQAQFNEMVTQSIASLAEAQHRTEANVSRTEANVSRLADIVARGNARQNETDARLDRLSEVVERLATRAE